MSKEGMTQGDLLSMTLYTLAEWFAYDAALVGLFAAIYHWFARLCKIGPPQGNQYLGGYLGEKELAQAYAKEKVTNW
eukprot:10795854-Ditylum_brightwellii.AAC.1